MRDPKRIDPFCDQLKEIWKRNPDWRFAQLIENADLNFYMEDEVAMQKLDRRDCSYATGFASRSLLRCQNCRKWGNYECPMYNCRDLRIPNKNDFCSRFEAGTDSEGVEKND